LMQLPVFVVISEAFLFIGLLGMFSLNVCFAAHNVCL
jgi:hypothetical protein